MNVEMRRLHTDDWRLWRAVRLEALADAPYAFGSTLEHWSGAGDTEANWRARLRDVPVNIVAIAGDRPAGQVGAAGPDDGGRVELISMWVAPHARGAGVGDALITAVVEWACEQNAPEVVLAVKRTNSAAIGLYERNGFVLSDEPAEESDEQMMVRSSLR